MAEQGSARQLTNNSAWKREWQTKAKFKVEVTNATRHSSAPADSLFYCAYIQIHPHPCSYLTCASTTFPSPHAHLCLMFRQCFSLAIISENIDQGGHRTSWTSLRANKYIFIVLILNQVRRGWKSKPGRGTLYIKLLMF